MPWAPRDDDGRGPVVGLVHLGRCRAPHADGAGHDSITFSYDNATAGPPPARKGADRLRLRQRENRLTSITYTKGGTPIGDLQYATTCRGGGPRCAARTVDATRLLVDSVARRFTRPACSGTVAPQESECRPGITGIRTRSRAPTYGLDRSPRSRPAGMVSFTCDDANSRRAL